MHYMNIKIQIKGLQKLNQINTLLAVCIIAIYN